MNEEDESEENEFNEEGKNDGDEDEEESQILLPNVGRLSKKPPVRLVNRKSNQIKLYKTDDDQI